MQKIKGFTWGWNYKAGDWLTQKAFDSIDAMIERTNCDTVIIPIPARQQTAQSTEIVYNDTDLPTKAEVDRILQYLQSKNMKIILKAVVDCKDGTWRAYINFITPDVVCEPKWSEWFENYTKYVKYVSDFAVKYSVDMLVIGCEMVCADAQELQWRKLISEIRTNYTGLLTYNCDKYQEDRIKWWDALDVISSSGYYPINDWKNQLERIQTVVDEYQKPFFFAELGCPSRIGSEKHPNDWQWQGEASQKTQDDYYAEMFSQIVKYSFVEGFAFWDWQVHLYDLRDANYDTDYSVYGKLAEKRIANFYKEWSE